jgi:uncharacterized RDD family membrane protein YckC
MSVKEPARAVPVGFEDRLAIATPEGVEIELTLAGLGSRFIAGLLDFFIRLLPLIALIVVVDPQDEAIGAAIFALADFGLQFFYYVLFEVLGGGRTPGKHATGLRVVRTGGSPVTFVRSMLRNIVRIVDTLPAFYFVGMVTIFITNNNQRLGDLAAGTLVVRDRHGDRRHGEAPSAATVAYDPGEAVNWDVSAVSAEDVATVRAFLERRSSIGSTARVDLAKALAGRLRPLVGGANEPSHERFLEMLVAAKARRDRDRDASAR